MSTSSAAPSAVPVIAPAPQGNASADRAPSTTPTRPVLRVIHSPGRPAPRGWQQALPLEWDLPDGLPATPAPPRHLRVVGAAPSAGESALPHPGAWVARLAPAIFEVIAGERPATQLTRWTSREILATLTRRYSAARRHPAGRDRAPLRRTSRSVRVHAVAPGIVEASAVISAGERCRALALRLEIIGRESAAGPRWLVTACEIG